MVKPRVVVPILRVQFSYACPRLMEDDAAGLVLRLALKTRFSEMGWGSTPPSSANKVRSYNGIRADC